MNRDHIEGGIRNLRGRAKTAVGAVGGRPGRQLEGAVDQAAGAAQYAYGRARDTAEEFARDGRHLAHEARERGQALYDEAESRGRHYRDRAERHGRALAHRANENRATTVAIVAAVAFGLGWLVRGRD